MNEHEGSKGGRPEFVDSTGRYRTTVDDGEATSTCVALAVAAVHGVAPDELTPLGTAVDPDAVDELFDGESGDRSAELRFDYEHCTVVVGDDGVVEVEPPADRTLP
jgi:hypothetical protein